MNKADRKAMKAAGPAYMPDPYGNFREGFQAACAHKQREIDALKARVGRLEKVLKELSALAADDVRPGATMLDAEDILDEIPTQSLAEVKAETLREFAHKLTKVDPEEWDCGDVPDLLNYEINQILQEAKE